MHDHSPPTLFASALPPACLDRWRPGLPELIASARAIGAEIDATEGDIAHFRFEAGAALILETMFDAAANDTALTEADRRLRELRERHAEAMRRVDEALAARDQEHDR